ncbi:DUF418 domain-containing protein [Runella zeae]|uniref:DUF418 domain-containing protein n=1 Tax=Runella zeae TaxID=94255 RepID=UPI0023570DD4|nr:DUF418 domain-containing protein [Runella zeae]
MKTNTAAAATERLLIVDGLRGFALFGILIAHITYWFNAGPMPDGIIQKFDGIPFQIAATFEGIFVSGKFYTFFSFLFGLSFALQIKSRDFTIARFGWRLCLLGLIGLIHSLHWRGDILSIYFVVGLVMIPLRRLTDKWLVVLAFLLILNLPSRIREVYHLIKPVAEASPQQRKIEETNTRQYWDMLKSGNYGELIKSNIPAIATKFDFQFDSGRIYITLGYFLLGLLAGRRRWFADLNENRSFFRRWLKISGWATLGIIAVAIPLGLMFGQGPPKPWLNIVMGGLFDAHSMFLTFFYITGMTLLLQKKSWASLLQHFSVIGKLALTSYLGQTLIGIVLFYGLGFNLLGEINPWICLLLTFPVYGLQVVFSHWWLSKFYYGPVEWLWRSLTYGRWQPMRRVAIS